MGSSATGKAAITGVVLQAVMVMLGTAVPALGGIPNFYAIAGSALAAITGAMAAKWSPAAASSGARATAGATAGAASSIVGGLLAVAAGQWPGFEIVQILFPAISGGVAGGLGGLVGRMFAK